MISLWGRKSFFPGSRLSIYVSLKDNGGTDFSTILSGPAKVLVQAS